LAAQPAAEQDRVQGEESMSGGIEARLAKIERELAILKAREGRDKSNWIVEITGSFKNDADFEEIVRLGKEIRDAELPGEE
jgi:hypothetical protein